jgi:hypothetical protein
MPAFAFSLAVSVGLEIHRYPTPMGTPKSFLVVDEIDEVS